MFVNDRSSFTSCEFYDNTAQNFGGAIHITGTRSSISVLDGIFVKNTAVTLGGGAIYSNSHYSNVFISSSTFTHNTASYCSVLDVDEYYHFNVSIIDSVFTSNTATGTLLGGGVACIRNASVTIRGSTYRNNHALLHGGVFHMDESHVLVDECSFLNNSATANGGVFYTYLHRSAYEVRRSEFSYNSAGEDGGVLYIGRVNSRVTNSQCVFTYNEASDRGGVAAMIGSSLYIDVNRAHIFNNTARLGGIISACNSEVNVGAGELFMSADPVYSFCTLYDEDTINYSGNITPTHITSAELTLTADGSNILSAKSFSESLYYTTFVIVSSRLMSESLISNKISSNIQVEFGDSAFSTILSTSPVSFYSPSNTCREINTVLETLTIPSTVSQYSNIISAASSNSIQNDNSTVPLIEYSSSPPMNTLSSMIITSSLAATTDLEITENYILSTSSISVSYQIVPVSSSSLDLNSLQHGLVTSEKSSLQVTIMETHMYEPLLSSSTFLQPMLSSTSEPIPSLLPSPTTSIKPSLSSKTRVSRVVAETNIVTVSTSVKNKLNTELPSTTSTTSSVSSLKIAVIRSLPPSASGSLNPHLPLLSGHIASSTSLEVEPITNGVSDSDMKLNITMAMVFVIFALLVVLIIFTGVLLVKKLSSKKTENSSNVSLLYDKQVKSVYKFSRSKYMETEMNENDF